MKNNLSQTDQAILASCDRLFAEVLDFTEEMIKQYAVLNQEQAILDLVERHMAELGLATTRVAIEQHRLADHPLFAPVDWDFSDKYNLVASLNPGAAGKTLVLNGHLDVVPANPVDMWSSAPHQPWRKDGWLYGRGAGDMQSGVAAMIYAVHAVRQAGFAIKSPLNIQAVVEEECSGNGALACLERGYGGDFVLIPEPFGPQIYSAQLGVLWFKIGCRGKPVHVLDTAAGVSAIEKLQLLIPGLQQLEAELNERYRLPPYDGHEHPFNLNIGKISGGNWASSVAANAELEARIGFPVGMTANEIMQRVSDCLERTVNGHPAFADGKPKLRFHGFRSEGHLVDTQAPGIQMLSDCHRALTAQEPDHYFSTCTTDLRAFHFYSKTAGTCYGPVAKRIHGVDEAVDMESVRHTLKAYALFISRWCEMGVA